MSRGDAPAFCLLGIILVAGCVSQPTGAGVAIENFESDFSDVFSGEPVEFSLRIRNTGSVDASTVSAHLLGLDEWGLASKTAMSCSGTGTLRAGQQAFGTSGEVWTCTASGQAPAVPAGLPVTYQPAVRVSYRYGSSIVKSVTIGSREELRRIQNLGTALPAETTSSTSGPITMTVTAKGPVRVFTSDLNFPVEITVSNTGGGTACSPDCETPANWNKLTISSPGGTLQGCDRELTLFRGQSNTITCTARVSAPAAGVVQKSFQVDAVYSYFIDRTISVRVNPIPDAGTSSSGPVVV